MKPIFFASQAEFRKWLEKNHEKETEVLAGFYKVGSGKPSMTWSESVDQALCFGWIDGVRRSVDAESYSIRFTPRRPRSVWSTINIKKIEELTKKGLMKPAGIAAFAKREEKRSGIYAYENSPIPLDKEFEKRFQKNKKAWEFFQSCGNWYRKQAARWVMSAKEEETKNRRFEKLLAESEAGRKV